LAESLGVAGIISEEMAEHSAAECEKYLRAALLEFDRVFFRVGMGNSALPPVQVVIKNKRLAEEASDELWGNLQHLVEHSKLGEAELHGAISSTASPMMVKCWKEYCSAVVQTHNYTRGVGTHHGKQSALADLLIKRYLSKD
jgi:hypothetical protein